MAQPESISRIPAAVALLIALGASPFFACRSSPDRGAAAVTAHALTALAVVEVRLTVQSSSVLSSPLKVVLAAKGDQFSSVLSNLAVAADYVFTAEALGAGGKLVAHGMASGVVISKGETTTVIIYLNEINQPSPFHNSSPLIDAITLSADSVTPGGHITVGATAHDPMPGKPQRWFSVGLPQQRVARYPMSTQHQGRMPCILLSPRLPGRLRRQKRNARSLSWLRTSLALPTVLHSWSA